MPGLPRVRRRTAGRYGAMPDAADVLSWRDTWQGNWKDALERLVGAPCCGACACNASSLLGGRASRAPHSWRSRCRLIRAVLQDFTGLHEGVERHGTAQHHLVSDHSCIVSGQRLSRRAGRHDLKPAARRHAIVDPRARRILLREEARLVSCHRLCDCAFGDDSIEVA